MTTAEEESQKLVPTELQFEACREEPLLDPHKEESDLGLTTTGMNHVLQFMKDFGVYGEVQVSDADARYTMACCPLCGWSDPKVPTSVVH